MAAYIALAGMDPLFFLRSENPETVEIMQMVANAARALRIKEMEHLAVLIANRVGDLFRG